MVSAQPFKAQNFIVAGPSPYMVQTAKDIIQKGGNIFDSAIASAFVLSVTTPYFVSLGCGGFALLKKNASNIVALDFRETAPHKTTANFFTKNNLSSRISGTAVATPGFVAGMWAIHKKYGKLPWSKLLKPAIRLAEKGFLVSGDHFHRTQNQQSKFNLSGKRIFFHSDTSPYLPGETLKQTKLARALRLLSRQGRHAFYKGSIGKDVIHSVTHAKGVISATDLHHYKVHWRTPIKWNFREYQLHSMPLPSSGGIILARALKLIEHFKKRYNQVIPFQSINENHLFATSLALAFKPRFNMGAKIISTVSKHNLALKKWLSDAQLKKLADKISLHSVISHSAKPSHADVKKPDTQSKAVKKETTHFSMMNNKGQAVSMTLTLNSNYGSFVVTKKYGIVLNNQMDDFNTRPGKANQFGLIQGSNNNVQGGKAPLSSMSPTIVEKKGRTVLVLGAAGGPMIISAVFQTLYHYLIHRLDLDLAVQAPRLHHQFLPNILYVDKNRFTPIIIRSLKRKGHNVRTRKSIATVQAVGALNDTHKLLEGAFDARGVGMAGGF